MSKKTEKRYQLLGWLLFFVCAVFFIAGSLEESDTLFLVGSIIFLLGCIAFLIPLYLGWNE